jgi:hypothetical protein
MKNNELPTIWLDMDGTIADLYGVIDWLSMLNTENTKPYREAKLLLDETQIQFLQDYIAAGGSVGIISWTSKTGSAKYNNRVRSAKVNWLKKHLPLPYAEIHVVKYGTPKSKFGKTGDILTDDEERNILDYAKDGKRLAFHPKQWDLMVDTVLAYYDVEEGE